MGVLENRKAFLEKLRASGVQEKREQKEARRNIQLPKRMYRSLQEEYVEAYKEWFNEFFEELRPNIDTWTSENVTDSKRSIRRDAISEELEKLVNKYLKEDKEFIEKIRQSASKHFDRIVGKNREQWRELIEEMYGKDVMFAEASKREMKNIFIQKNVSLIKNVANENLRNVERIIYDGVTSGERPESIAGKIKHGTSSSFKKYKNRCKVVARDQLSKAYSDINRVNQRNIGVNKYFWDTVEDSDVRKSHSVLNGKLCKWADPSVYKDSPKDERWKSRSSIGGYIGHPGEDYQCRCVAQPFMPDLK